MRGIWLASALLIISVWSAVAKAGPAGDFWSRWRSSRLEVIADRDPMAQWTEGRHPDWLYSLSQATAFSPETRPTVALEPSCSPDDLEEGLRSRPQARAQGELIEKMFQRCAGDWESGVRDRVRNAWQIMRLRLDWPSHPLIRRVSVRLPGGGQLKGLLALKGDLKKRPFVVVRLGVFANIEEFLPERFLLMQLFEQGPSNVLVIENITGADHIANNPGFSFGGLVEGFQNLQLARMLRDPAEPLARLVGSLHFVGMSLGAHGLFHAATLTAKQSRMNPLIDSFVAFCPVVHLRPTLESTIRGGLDGVFADFWIRTRLGGLRRKWTDLPSGWSSWWRGEPSFFPAVLAKIEAEHRWNPAWAEGLNVPPHWHGDYWRASDPWKDWSLNHPEFLVVATKDDELVPLSQNSARLRAEMLPRDPRMGVAILEQGFHCTLPVAYKWDVIAALLNGAVLAHARIGETPTSMDIDLEPALGAKTATGRHRIDYDVDWPAEGRFVSLKFKVGHDEGESRFSLNLPVSQFDFRSDSALAENPALRESLERWLHRRLKTALVSKDGQSSLRVQWPRLNER